MKEGKNIIEDLLQNLPDSLNNIREEAGNVGKSLLESQLQKADIVTREEFDEQKAILQAIVEKLDRLEALVSGSFSD